VNGPLPDRVSTKSAALTAATRVLKDVLALATSTIVPTVFVWLVTVGVFAVGLVSAKVGTLATNAVAAMTIPNVLLNKEFIVVNYVGWR
jgi:hypothetical protein